MKNYFIKLNSINNVATFSGEEIAQTYQILSDEIKFVKKVGIN